MTNLDTLETKIEEFIQNSIRNFKTENNSPSSIGIYCCPWAGWLTVNFNINKTISDTSNNCPDFEFVAFDFLELPELSDENEKETSIFLLKNKDITINKDLGDEGLNEVLFEFLNPIATRIKNKNNLETLIQMLDSTFVEMIN